MIRIDILNNASEVLFRDSLNLNDALFLQLVFFKVVLVAEHVVEVVTSGSEDKTVSFD